MFDAVVLAGGSAARLDGADKPGIEVDGSSLLERVIDAVRAAATVIVVGPPRDVSVEVRWCREDPVGAGPVAAIAAGLEHVRSGTTVLLAADLPWIAGAVDPLTRALSAGSGDVAMLVDTSGRTNYLAAAWHTPALRQAVLAIGDPNGAPVRALYRDAVAIELRDDMGWATDCDTWSDIERARSAAPGWRQA